MVNPQRVDDSGRALHVAALHAGYGRFDVVRDIGLDVAPGEAVALLGPNGAGKTTVLRAVMGLVKHRGGTVTARGTDLLALPVHRIARGHAALVPEGRRLFLGQSVEDNLLLGALHLRGDPDRVRRLLASVFELFPVVERYRARPAAALSGGEQQMVAIGRTMMSDPGVMLLDEPSLGLAPLAIADVTRALVALRERGASMLVVEQRMDLARQLCDRVYVLSEGRVVRQGGVEILDSGDDVIDAYLGGGPSSRSPAPGPPPPAPGP